MYASPLIRVVDQIETPALGHWTIGPSQTVLGTRRDSFRRVAGTGRTIDGTLAIGDERVGSSMDLTVAVDDLPFPVAATLHYRAAALVPTREGIWLLNGDLTVGAVTRPLRSIVRYHGVFRNGDRATAWLTLHARVDLAKFPLGDGLRRFFVGRHLDLTAELNADAPATTAPKLQRMREVMC